MNRIPKRMNSTTRLSHRSNGLSIYYRRGNDEIEEEMMRVTVITDEENDTLRSSNSETIHIENGLLKKNKNKKSSSKSSFLEKWNESKRKPFHFEFMNEDTTRILNDLKTLNAKIRMRFQIGRESASFVESMDKLNRDKSKNLSFFTDSSSNSSSFSSSSSSISSDSSPQTAKIISKTVSLKNSPILTAEAFDYRGKPLPPTWTPFPRSRSPKSNKKGKNISKKEEKKSSSSKTSKPSKSLKSSTSSSGSSFIKPPVAPISDSSSSFISTASFKSIKNSKEKSPIKLTRISSDTKFPCARSPETRIKMRKLLREYAEKKIIKEKETAEFHSREDANLANQLKKMIKEKKKNESETTEKTTNSSLKTIYSKSNMSIGCENCSSCIQCINYCIDEHSKIKMKYKNTRKILKSEVF